jgi:septal ring factor EnvC (AmiA/AmiB activator)
MDFVTPLVVGVVLAVFTVVLDRLNKGRFDAMDKQNREFRAEVRSDLADFKTELRADLADFKTELRSELAEFRTEVRSELAEFKSEMKAFRAEMAAMRSDLTRVALAVMPQPRPQTG